MRRSRHGGLANARLRGESASSNRNQGESQDMWRGQGRRGGRDQVRLLLGSGLLQAGKKVVLMVEVKIALMLMVLIPQGSRQL